MFDLYVVLGGVAVAISVLVGGFWIAKRLGAAEAHKREREGNLETQRKIASILASRDRSHRELTDWMRDKGDD